MIWITPKTNWQNGDFFNHIDYNRISGNIDYIRDMVGLPSIYTPKDITGYMRVSEYNAISQELTRLYTNGNFSFAYYGVADRNSYSSPWDASQLNTIEDTIRQMYLELSGERIQIADESKSNNLVSEDTIDNIYSE